MCDLTYSEEMRCKQNRSKWRGKEENIYEQFIQGLRNLGEAYGSLGMFFVRDIWHLASPKLKSLQNQGYNLEKLQD